MDPTQHHETPSLPRNGVNAANIAATCALSSGALQLRQGVTPSDIASLLRTATASFAEAMANRGISGYRHMVSRRRRLAAQIAAERGWQALTVSTWVVLRESEANRRRVRLFASTLRAAFPANRHAIREWLHRPLGSIDALSFGPIRLT
jgi:hypothetical protein